MVPTIVVYTKNKPGRTSSEFRANRAQKRKFIDEVCLSASSVSTPAKTATATSVNYVCDEPTSKHKLDYVDSELRYLV